MAGGRLAGSALAAGAARRPAAGSFALLCTSVAIAAVSTAAVVPALLAHAVPVGIDYGIYMDATRRWLAGGGFYLARQLAGPYEVVGGDVLYPPVSLALFVPFLALPALLWWAVPLGVVACRVAAPRPAPWSWPLLALCAANPWSLQLLWNGNPTIWIAAAVALATRWPAASALVLLKPSLLPLALVGVRSRWWWALCAALAVASLALLPMDLEWARSVLDGRGTYSGVWYSATHAPFAALALVAWLARREAARPARPRGRAPRARTASLSG